MTQIEQILSFFVEEAEDDNVVFYDIKEGYSFEYNGADSGCVGINKNGTGYKVYDEVYGTREATAEQLIKGTHIYRFEQVI